MFPSFLLCTEQKVWKQFPNHCGKREGLRRPTHHPVIVQPNLYRRKQLVHCPNDLCKSLQYHGLILPLRASYFILYVYILLLLIFCLHAFPEEINHVPQGNQNPQNSLNLVKVEVQGNRNASSRLDFCEWKCSSRNNKRDCTSSHYTHNTIGIEREFHHIMIELFWKTLT